ncbi:hypothetical protein B0T26DRAFT_651014, partial [Lasiosphaeria miniovina]
LASLSSCNYVTGSVVAKDHGITLGEWDVKVEGLLPTKVLVGREQGNPNWEKVLLDTDIWGGMGDDAMFQLFVRKVERRCPFSQLFKLSGVVYKSRWVNGPL